MARNGEQVHHFKRVALPSGKTIEVLHFDEPSGEQPQAKQLTSTLDVCAECDKDLVYPADWEEAGRQAWRVTLVCPNCGCERRDVFADDAVEALEEALDRGTDAIARDYRALLRSNMADEVESFVAALDADAIQPMDF